MSDRPPSAAQSLYPHLKSQERPVQQQRGDLASVMYPGNVKPRPIPEDPYLAYMQRLGFIRTSGRR
jgi:hypothetical protein